MNIRQLRYFVKVVESGNLTQAARQLNVSQPALGQQIKLLEQGCKIELFSRHSRGIEPTPAGHLLYNRARAILGLIADTEVELRSLKQSPEVLRVGMVRSIIRQLGANLLLDARELLPNVGIHLTEDFSLKLVEAVRCNEIDVVLAYNVGTGEGVSVRSILRESFVLISKIDEGRSPSADIPLKDTLHHKLVFHESYYFVRKALEDASSAHGIPLDVAFVAQSSEALFDAVEAGLASAIAPYGMMENLVRSGRARAQRIVEPTITRQLHLVRSRSSFVDDPAVDRFAQRLCDRMRDSLKEFSESIDEATPS